MVSYFHRRLLPNKPTKKLRSRFASPTTVLCRRSWWFRPDSPLLLTVVNSSRERIEFESFKLNREKVVGPGETVTVHLPPLHAGTYDFFDDFHPDVPEGSFWPSRPGDRTMNPEIRSSAPGAAAMCVLAALPCAAQVDPWEFEVYPYSTTPRGWPNSKATIPSWPSGHSMGGEGTAVGTIPSQGCGTMPTSSPTASPTGSRPRSTSTWLGPTAAAFAGRATMFAFAAGYSIRASARRRRLVRRARVA